MGSHERETHESILRGASRRNNGVDEHAILESLCCSNECLLNIVNIERNNRTLCLTDLKALFLEAAERVACNLPKVVDALRLILDDL